MGYIYNPQPRNTEFESKSTSHMLLVNKAFLSASVLSYLQCDSVVNTPQKST